MPNINWSRLRLDFLRGGVSIKVTNRTITELQHHHADLYQSFAEHETDLNQAKIQANAKLGSEKQILQEVLSKPELKSWLHRYPLASYLLAPALGYIFLFLLFDVPILRSFIWFQHAAFTYTAEQGLSEVPMYLQILCESGMFFMMHFFAPVFLILLCKGIKKRSISTYWPMLAAMVVAVLGSGWSYSIDWGNGFIFHGWGYSFIGSPEPIEPLSIEVTKIALTFLSGFLISYFYRPLEKELNLVSGD